MNATDTELVESLSYFDVGALTIYGEGRGEPVEGKIAIGNVIKNRAATWQKTIIEICLQPFQFSCWNDNDPNYSKLINLAKQLQASYSGSGYYGDDVYNECRYLMIGISDGTIRDNTGDALNYLTLELASGPNCPTWAKNMKGAIHIGSQVFGRA